MEEYASLSSFFNFGKYYFFKTILSSDKRMQICCFFFFFFFWFCSFFIIIFLVFFIIINLFLFFFFCFFFLFEFYCHLLKVLPHAIAKSLLAVASRLKNLMNLLSAETAHSVVW